MAQVTRVLRTAAFVARSRIERSLPFWTEERIRWLQERRLRAMVTHAYVSVPFYRDAMDRLRLTPDDIRTAEDLARMPLIGAEHLHAEPNAFVSERYKTRKTCVLYSTGTGGHGRRLVTWNTRAILRQLVYGERDRAVLSTLLGKRAGLCRLSLMPPGGAAGVVTDFHRSSVWIPSGLMRTHTVSPALPYKEIVTRINEVQPDVVFSYGSFAEHFARYVLDHSIPLHLPKVWVYGADALTERGWKALEEGLGCIVHSTYQAVEAGRIGFLCEEHQGFHLNVDLCPVRIVDGEGRTVGPGKLGEVVVSNLYNYATVLLNYRLGDRATLASSPCACGRTLPRLERLEGRSSDVLHLSSGQEILDISLLHACADPLRHVLQSQIIEEACGQFHWLVVPAPEADLSLLERCLVENAHSILDPDDSIQIRFVEQLPINRLSKLSRVMRDQPEEANDSSSS